MRQMRTFPADPLSVAAARKFVVSVLPPASEEARQAAQLLVSELATNVVRHVHTDFTVTVQDRDGCVLVEVADHGAGTPVMRSPGTDEPSGRGLRIVDTFSEAWGIENRRPVGKTVWFTLAVNGGQPRPG